MPLSYGVICAVRITAPVDSHVVLKPSGVSRAHVFAAIGGRPGDHSLHPTPFSSA
jgi:hypothetical protein